ncbi:MAG: serpin family protein [Terricaulis sp.]
MKSNRAIFSAIFAAAVTVGACASAANAGGGATTTEAPVRGSDYETSLYRQVARGDGNQLISPFSLKAAFALLYPGARGATADEMTGVFDFTGDDDPAGHEARLTQDLESSGVFKSADAVWIDRQFALAPDYAHAVRDTLHAQVEALDFHGAAESSRTHINSWVSAQTNARIPDLLPPGFITPDMQLVLTNAVYFKADWQQPFAVGSTHDAPFHPLTGPDQNARMMHSVRRVRYFEDDDFQAADFDFKDGRFALTIFLPRANAGLPALEQRLSGDRLHGWLNQINGADGARLDVNLPKLRLEQRYDLGAQLQAMGLHTTFTEAADFSGVSANPDLVVSRVVQNTFFAMDEVGVEAAAATGIGVVTTAMPRPEAPPIAFNADHPFLLVLRDRRTGTIAFMGRVTSIPGNAG